MNWNRAESRVFLLTVALLLPFLGWCGGSAKAASASGASFVLSIQGDHLSAKIDSISLREVLERLSRLADLDVSLEGSVGEELISVEFENLPLEEGIRWILQGKSYALTYATAPLGSLPSPKVVGISVVSKGAGPPLDKEDADSVITLSGTDAREGPPKPLEARTREALVPPESATISDLRDRDPKVREAALERLGQSSQAVPVEILAEMALTDASPQLRMEALDLLAEKGGDAALDSLKQALRDPDPGVHGLAQGLLEERKAMAQVLLEELKEESR